MQRQLILFVRAQQVHTMSPTDDEAMMEHIKELLAEVGEEEVVAEEESNPLEYTEENLERAEKIAEILDTDGIRDDDDEPMEGWSCFVELVIH